MLELQKRLRFTATLLVNMVCSTVIAIANKVLLRETLSPTALLSIHYVAGFLCTSSLCETKSRTTQREEQLPAQILAVLSLTTVLNLLSAQTSLKLNSLFVFQAGRYFAIVLTAVGDQAINSLGLNWQKLIGLVHVLLAVCCILLPLLKLTRTPHHQDNYGAIICVLAATAQAVNGVVTNFVLKTYAIENKLLLNKLSQWNGVVFVSVALSQHVAGKYTFHITKSTVPLLMISTTSAVLIQYTSLGLTRSSSATFYASINVLKAALLSVGGSLILREAVTELNWLALALSSIGLFLFGAETFLITHSRKFALAVCSSTLLALAYRSYFIQ